MGTRAKVAVILIVLALALGLTSLAYAGGMSGAVFTTNSACNGTNVNIFAAKNLVYLDGGPAHPGAAGLPDGSYFVQVTQPDGTLLGKTLAATVTVSGGEFATCYQLTDILYSTSSAFTAKGFDDTGNAGGEYKVWASQNAAFPGSESKTDNFKVAPSVTEATLKVQKFYDANTDGAMNGSEPFITDWKVNIKDGINWDRYTPVTIFLAPDDYTVSEYMPIETNWYRTTSNPQTVTLAGGSEATVQFGNVCTGAGGGLTLGFWSNNNGEALMKSTDNFASALAFLRELNLRNADGSAFDPTSYAPNKKATDPYAFRPWLLGASATNMAYMLSAQLAAMELNVRYGKVTDTSLIYAPGTPHANSAGFATVATVMADANAELRLHGLVLDGSPYRAVQEALKNALDKANNNLTFVQASPCDFSFPE